MSLAELLSAIRRLTADEKRALIRTLSEELAEGDLIAQLASESVYPVWSPFEAYEAAAALEQVLRQGDATT